MYQYLRGINIKELIRKINSSKGKYSLNVMQDYLAVR